MSVQEWICQTFITDKDEFGLERKSIEEYLDTKSSEEIWLLYRLLVVKLSISKLSFLFDLNSFTPSYGMTVDEADWWIHRHIDLRYSNIHAHSCSISFSQLLTLMMFINWEQCNAEIFKLFNSYCVQVLPSHLTNEEMALFLFQHHVSIFMFIRSHYGDSDKKYIVDILDKYVDGNQYVPCISFEDLVSLYPYEKKISDTNELETVCDTVIKDNPKSVEDYRKGKVNSINHLKGQVMKLTKGKADVKIVSEILERKLKL